MLLFTVDSTGNAVTTNFLQSACQRPRSYGW